LIDPFPSNLAARMGFIDDLQRLDRPRKRRAAKVLSEGGEVGEITSAELERRHGSGREAQSRLPSDHFGHMVPVP
jgi:hypothetical protein